jgi:hypothetical protein
MRLEEDIRAEKGTFALLDSLKESSLRWGCLRWKDLLLRSEDMDI